jgi:Sulfotransferase domain
MHANRKADFLIVGTQKGGTSALARFLGQHPEIFIPDIKEAHFFDYPAKYLNDSSGLPSYDAYHELFASARPTQLWGEATPIYMFLPFVPDRIHEYNPNLKLIFLLRDPAMRAFSHYKMQRSRHRERWPFPIAAALEPFRLLLLSSGPDHKRDPIRRHSYLSRGFYSAQVERFLRQFPRENCCFIKSKDLLREHDNVLRRIFAFLGVDPDFKVAPASVFVGPQGEPNAIFDRILRLIYRRERYRLQRLTGIDFSDWGLPPRQAG